MRKIETKEDLKVGHYYRTTDHFFRVDSIVDGEPHGSEYHIFQIEPIITINTPLGIFVEEMGCIEIFEEEYKETFQRILIKNKDNENI